MLYEPPKTKKYILIGAIAVALAVLAIVAIPLIFKDKTNQTPVANLSLKENLQQQKIQKELDKLETMRKNMNLKQPTQEEIQKEFENLEKKRTESGAISLTPEQIREEFEKLEQMKK